MVTPSRITVVADDRECPGRLFGELAARPEVRLRTERLSAGDYRVDGSFLVERKTLTDLGASIVSGRLFAQALRLARVDGLRPVLLLEGRLSDLRGSGLRWEAIQGSLVTVAVFIGLPVLRAPSAKASADTLLFLARQGRSLVRGALPRNGRRPRGKRGYQLYLLQGLPGIGPRRAESLLARFGSLAGVVNADPGELSDVSGIGAETARRIKWAVGEAATPYRGGYSGGGVVLPG